MLQVVIASPAGFPSFRGRTVQRSSEVVSNIGTFDESWTLRPDTKDEEPIHEREVSSVAGNIEAIGQCLGDLQHKYLSAKSLLNKGDGGVRLCSMKR